LTKSEWQYFRENLSDVQVCDTVVVYYHWNFGTTRSKRARQYGGILDIVDEQGVIMDLVTRHKRFDYKVIDCISSLAGGLE